MTTTDGVCRPGAYWAAAACLLFAFAATLMLVVQHLGGIALPGCGPGSACALAQNSAWGKVPVIEWPVSFIGFSYFLGMLIAWLRTARLGVSATLRYLIRVGMAVSVMYVVVIALQGHACLYCLATHAANFVFWLIVESSLKSVGRSRQPTGILAGVFVAASLVLGVVKMQRQETTREKQEQALADSTSKIIQSSQEKGQTRGSTDSVAVSGGAAGSRRWPNGFTGRHRRGPDKAAIRIVLFSDFQCPDCKRTEQDIEKMMETRKDVSVSFRHFPMNSDCNPKISNTLHGNACWAARASEAAAILRGEEGFWQMHRWLFDNNGRFENNTLPPVLQSMGYDAKQFIEVMSGQEVLRRVQEDCEDAHWLGLHYTPMVFINGVELKGVFTAGALPRAVELLAAKNPPVMGCEHDDPPPAAEKLISDWRDQYVKQIPSSAKSWPIGPADAKLQVVVWGDLQESYTARVDQVIRQFIAGRTDSRYEFRPYPVNMRCNPYTQVDRFPRSCTAHKAAIAAGLLGDSNGYWRMQEWLTANREIVDEYMIRQIAPTMGLDADRLMEMMESDEVSRIITQDAGTGRTINLSAVPTIYVNGKFVPRWLRENESVLERVMTEALEK